jgi:hypothetical protein
MAYNEDSGRKNAMTNEPKAVVEQKRFHRVPGLYDRFDLGFMLDEHVDYYIEKAGESDQGDSLYALYEGAFICKDCRDQEQHVEPVQTTAPGAG